MYSKIFPFYKAPTCAQLHTISPNKNIFFPLSGAYDTVVPLDVLCTDGVHDGVVVPCVEASLDLYNGSGEAQVVPGTENLRVISYNNISAGRVQRYMRREAYLMKVGERGALASRCPSAPRFPGATQA